MEGIDFEELSDASRSADFAWGSAAFGFARAVVRCMDQAGDLADLPRYFEISNLPLHVWRREGERIAIGPVEERVTEPTREIWTQVGLAGLTGVRGEDTALIVSQSSLAGTPLFGE